MTLWTDGDMTLRVEGTDRIVRIDRPFGLVGQDPDCDIRVLGPAVNRRHVYLHLDPRGVYAVDLVTRSGIQINGNDQVAGWLGPGDWLEVGDERIELLRIRIHGAVIDPPPTEDDPLSETGPAPLATLALEPTHGSAGPWSIGSELMFLGWSSACAIQVKDPAIAKVHCALVRARDAAYVVDLQGQATRVDGRSVRGAARLDDGAALTIGATRFTARVGLGLHRLPAPVQSSALVARVINPELLDDDERSHDLDLDPVPSGSQNAILAWMVETLQQTQGTVLRQQGEMQANLVGMLRQIQQDNSSLLNAHLARIERIDHELSSLRAELTQRSDDPAAAAVSLPPTPPTPQVTPLRIERQTPEPARSRASTTWLLQRVNQLENENKSAWKELLGRVSPPPRRPPAP